MSTHTPSHTAVRGRQPASAPSLPGLGAAVRHQLRFDLRTQWRTPAAVLFTLLLPIGFLLLFAASAETPASRAEYVPTTIIIGVFSGSLTNLAITLTYLREYGMLKQTRLQPVPPAAFLLSRVLAAGLLAVLSAVLVGIVGGLLYDASPAQIGLLAAAVLLGTAIGSGLGLLVSTAIRSEVASTPIANAVTLPLLVLAGAFVPLTSLPDALQTIAQVLPGWGVSVLAQGGYGTGPGVEAGAWINAGAWSLASLALGLRAFRWTPYRRR